MTVIIRHKTIFLVLLFFTLTNISQAQINTFNGSSYNFYEDLIVAIDDYNSTYPDSNCILLVDYFIIDSINSFRILWSYDFLEILYKQPDAFMLLNNNIVYIYTKNYFQNNDSVWMETVFNQTQKIFGMPFMLNINWGNGVIYSEKGRDSTQVFISEPRIYNGYDLIEYSVKDKEIVMKKNAYKMYFPDSQWSQIKRSYGKWWH